MFKRFTKWVGKKVIPSVVMATTGNVGGAVTNLFKKDKSQPKTVGSQPEKPSVVLAYESQNGDLERANFAEQSVQAEKSNSGSIDWMKYLPFAGVGLAMLMMNKKR